MLDKVLKITDIMERYGVSRQTASKYMRQMQYMEKPLRVTESAVRVWEWERTQQPAQKKVKSKPVRLPVNSYPIPYKKAALRGQGG